MCCRSVVKYGELELFLCGLDLSDYVNLFQQQHVDFSIIMRMTDEDLIKVKKKTEISEHIRVLRWEVVDIGGTGDHHCLIFFS